MTIQSTYPTFVRFSAQKPAASARKSTPQQEPHFSAIIIKKKKRPLLDSFQAPLVLMFIGLGAVGLLHQPKVDKACSVQETTAQVLECGQEQGENKVYKDTGKWGLLYGGVIGSWNLGLNKLDDIREKRRAKKLAEAQKDDKKL